MSWIGATLAVIQAVPTEYIAGAIVVGSNIKSTVETVKWMHRTATWAFSTSSSDERDDAWQWVDEDPALIIETNMK